MPNKKYIHSFETQSDFNNVYISENYLEPWTSYNYDNHLVKFNKSEEDELLETPLTFNILSSGNIKWYAYSANNQRTIEYKKNDGAWTEITAGVAGSEGTIAVVSGDVVQFRGSNNAYSSGSLEYNGFLNTDCTFTARGNIMSLINKNTFPTLKSMPQNNGFQYFFKYVTGLVGDASKIILPATTLCTRCYMEMFRGTGITKVPKLPATTLTTQCYTDMFAECNSLIFVPEDLLPAMTLATSCYDGMFCRCTNLLNAPRLPATTLATKCYGSYSSWGGMFRGCTKLQYPPELPAMELADACYHAMFAGCSMLKVAPKLPATTLVANCYAQMFNSCTSLTVAPDLPALTLVGGDYGCYGQMFRGSGITRIKCLATSIPSASCTGLWLYQIPEGGTFIKHPNMNDWTRDTNGVPASWTIEDAVL